MRNQEDLVQKIFGWNPYNTESGNERPLNQRLPKWAAENHEIAKLTDLSTAEIAEQHQGLLDDQNYLAKLLEPYFDKSTGQLIKPLDESVLLFKKGLDFRLLEFEEDCRRIQQTERTLQRKIEDCTLTYEASLVETKNLAEKHLMSQIYEQQKIIQCQQIELDELRFQRDLYADESFRLRQLCRYGDFRPSNVIKRTPLVESPKSIHQLKAKMKPQFEWMDNIKVNPTIKQADQQPIQRNLSKPTGVQTAKRSWVLPKSQITKTFTTTSNVKFEPKNVNCSPSQNVDDPNVVNPVNSASYSETAKVENHFLNLEPITRQFSSASVSQSPVFSQGKSNQPSDASSVSNGLYDYPSKATEPAILSYRSQNTILPEEELLRLKDSGLGLPLKSSRRHQSKTRLTVKPNLVRKDSVPLSPEAVSRFFSSQK